LDAADIAIWLAEKEDDIDFTAFYKALDDYQKNRFDTVLTCIEKCIGY
jgi:hypothetical protein